ncbi:glycoside hydrolase family 70 protein [Limosilactobacillus fermentum]|uniref:glycoside hydrolase family 70 protein n=3 Tax=Limosilactobacillus fermentum TaxID=1613 RepID=UPI0020188C42|nr:glycoside hydrolase family 70 protein [Limosilactobacillus fermentum]MCL3986605.1 KxYKxGKxW signal peptide domain-containing protein [Limosilactobacillus fermentum]
MEFKKHFKLYKSGKQWCIAAVVTFTATLGLVAGNTTVNADTLTTGGSTPQAQVNQEKGITNTSQPASDQGKTSNTGDVRNTVPQPNNSDKTNQYQADTLTTGGSTPQAQVNQEKGITNTSQPASDQGKTSNTGDVRNTVPQPNNSGKTNQSQNGQDQKESAGNDNGSTGNNDQNKGQQTTDWQKNANNQWVYNGKTDQDLKGTQYVQLPTIPDTNVQGNTNWYFVKDGIAQSGVQQWAGTYYYFDPTTYLRVDNDYRQSQWGDWYMFGNDGRVVSGLYNYKGNTYYANPSTYLREKNTYIQTEKDGRGVLLGNDGAALSGVQQWAGTYYYFDPVTHLRVDNNYVQSQWGDWYLFGNDGRILSGVQQWAGTYYYFDPTTYLRVDDDYVTSQWGLKYMFGKDGRIATGLYKWDKNNQWYYFNPTTYLAVTNNYIQANDGHWYLFTADGTAASRVAKWAGTYYYFDPVTHLRVDNNYVQSQWGDWYMFGNDGRIITGRTLWYGNYYYFDPVTYLKVTNKWVDGNYYDEDGAQAISKLVTINNRLYYFDDQGKEISNQFRTIHGNTYYFGNDSAAVTGLQTIDGKIYKFSDYGYLLGNRYGKIENGKLNIYSFADNSLIKTVEAGPWENMAYSMDSNSINNIDGYISYTGWYRPYGTSQDGKTWYPTTVADWRPILMYIWPSKDVQAQFIKYFVNNGYENANYGLTKGSVANLNKDTDATVLNTAAQNLRYVIEQSIATNKGTGKLANDINGFAATVPELSASSELPYGQVIFVNNDNTSYADSKYRLMSRTINNQTGNDNSDNGYEFLTGIDIDNSNPVVQAENLNWEYFLLNYGKLMGYNQDGNFDGFRIDAADHIDADVLDQMGQLMDDMYHMKGNPQNANNHLSYNEGYRSGAARMLNKKGNPQLYMDYVGSTLGNVLGRANNRDTISNLITGSIVNRQNDVTENEATPNWSYVTNHDQRANLINGLISKDHPGAYKAEYANQAWQEFYADQKKTDKQYAQYNVPAQYAILLSNKDTVPQIYYGDLYNETAQYMQEKSIYYDAITTLMKARKQFVSGGQTMTKLSDNLIASVRYGKGVANANSEGTDSLSRTSGMAVIVGNNPQMAEQTISINMGRAHANEQYRNLLDTTDNGLTYNADGAENPETLTTDDNGILKVTVKGYSNPYVSGYLGVWVPVVSGNQDVTTNAATVSADSNKIFESNAALDSHMIYQDFSLYQPEPTSTENHAYNIIAQNAELFNNLGITDFWMAPPYTPYSESRYNDGYSVTDRYNLGTNANPTKYGSGEELANAIAALHSAGLKVQVDIVMNQMIGLPGQEAVTVTRADNRGIQTYVNGKTYANQMYFAYTTGGGNGQETYGGKYLSELRSKYPDLFTTRAISTGVAPDPTTRITKWSAKYENGTSLQNIGIGLAVKLPNGEYAYLRSSDNKSFNTTLPETMSSADYYANIEDD